MRVDLEVLWEEVERVKGTCAKDPVVEIFTYLCYSKGKLVSFDGTSGTITPTILGDLGDFCVLGKKWASILSAVKADEEGTVTLMDGWLYVKARQFETKIPVYPADEFPDIQPEPGKPLLDNVPMKDALKQALTFVEKDKTKGAITSLGVVEGHVYATDRLRVTKASLNATVDKFTVTQEAAQQILKLGDPDKVFTSRAMLVAFYSETNTYVVSRQVAGKFPFHLFEKMFEQEVKHLVPIPEGFKEAAERVLSFAEDDEGVLLLYGSGSAIQLSTADTEAGGAKDNVRAETPVFRAKLKGAAVKTCLRSMKPTHMDLTDLVEGQKRQLVFVGPGFQCAFALMV